MADEGFVRMLMAALREPQIKAAILRIVNEHNAEGHRRMAARQFERASRVTPQGSLSRKGAIKAVVPK